MTIQLFKFDDLRVRSTMHGGQSYFAVKEIGEAMRYSDISQFAKHHVDPEYFSVNPNHFMWIRILLSNLMDPD